MKRNIFRERIDLKFKFAACFVILTLHDCAIHVQLIVYGSSIYTHRTEGKGIDDGAVTTECNAPLRVSLSHLL